MQGDKWRETRRHGQPRAGQNGDYAGRQWRETKRQRQPRAAQNGDHAGRQMKGDKAAAAAKSRPLRSKNPYSFQLSGEQSSMDTSLQCGIGRLNCKEAQNIQKNIQTAKHTYSPIGFGLHKLLCRRSSRPLVKDPPLLLSPSFVRDDPLDRGPSVVVWDPPRTFVRDSQSQMPFSRLATLSLREPRLCYWPVQDPRLCSRPPVRDF